MQRLKLIHWGLSALLLPLALALALTTAASDSASGSPHTSTATPVAPDWSQLGEFYLAGNLQPLWHHGLERSHQVNQLIEQINKAERDGLNPEDYHLSALITLPPAENLAEAAEADALISGVAVRLVNDLRNGRYSGQAIDPLWRIDQEPFNAPLQLHQSLAKGGLKSFFDTLPPDDEFYTALKGALEFYRRIAASGGWSTLPAGPSLHPGDTDRTVPLLRQRLIIEGDYLAKIPDERETFDSELEAAVTHYQLRHGLEVDGVLGAKTREAMNVPVASRIEQLRANMERRRWLPHDLGERYLLVNTAGFEVRLVEGGKTSLVKRSINGKRWRKTPSFSSRITHLVVNPYWTVPKRIAVVDLLPLQRRDSHYFEKKRIDVLRRTDDGWSVEDPDMIDWSLYNRKNFPFTLRQHPGDDNSLGKLKFYMPNPYNIYLHDTPSRELFERNLRAFSSGCIRVEHPLYLAEMLLGDKAQALDTPLGEQVASGKTQRTTLPKPVPIYLVYLTSWVDEFGVIQFRPDGYHLNQPLIQALQRNNTPSALAYRSGSISLGEE